ncbi:unnamed protein product, partial [Staurois parvus]
MYTDHQSTDDQCALMICVAPAAPPVSVHQCQLSVLIRAHPCPGPIRALSGPIRATFQGPSVPHFRAHPCHISGPIRATFQGPSVPHFRAHPCHISGP